MAKKKGRRVKLTEDQKEVANRKGVDILWWDASSPDSKAGWLDDDEHACLKLCRTRGFIKSEDDRELVIIGSISEEEGRAEETAIPVGSILRRIG